MPIGILLFEGGTDLGRVGRGRAKDIVDKSLEASSKLHVRNTLEMRCNCSGTHRAPAKRESHEQLQHNQLE